MALFIVAGGLVLFLLVRRVDRHPFLAWAVLGSYVLRAGLALGMFWISLYRWPALLSQQLGSGFWLFGLDSTTYHLYGAAIAKAWATGIEIPDPQLNITYFLVVGQTDRILGGCGKRRELCSKI